jgi:hypothetical protein
MPKREPEDVAPSCARAQPNQRLPKGHFDDNGTSQGDMIGEGRTTHDAYQGERSGKGEAK